MIKFYHGNCMRFREGIFVFLCLFIFVAFSMCLILSFRTKLAYISTMYLLGCLFVFMAGFCYFSAITTYQTVGTIDRNFFKLLSGLKINIYTASVIHNIGIVLFMIVPVLCLRFLYSVKWRYLIPFFLPVLYVFAVNLPAVKWWLYQMFYAGETENLRTLVTFLNRGSVVLFFLYLAAPVLIFLLYTLHTKIFVKRKKGFTCLSCILLIHVNLYLLLFRGAFAPTMFYNMSLMGFPMMQMDVYRERFSILLCVLLIMISNLFILWYYKPLERYGFGRKRRFVRQSRMVDENVFMLLHIYKNKFVCIEKLARQGAWANGEQDSEETAHMLESIQKESAESVDHISRTLRMLNMIAIDYSIFLVESSMEDAISQIKREDIRIICNYGKSRTAILGNKAHMTESFVNIFRNSIEAIEQTNRTDGEIRVELYKEPDMVLVTVTDNGCGIPKKQIKKVFRPFYSTKDQKLGNGLGLEFVKRVCRIHGGDVKMQSQENEYTKLLIALPIYEMKKR